MSAWYTTCTSVNAITTKRTTREYKWGGYVWPTVFIPKQWYKDFTTTTVRYFGIDINNAEALVDALKDAADDTFRDCYYDEPAGGATNIYYITQVEGDWVEVT